MRQYLEVLKYIMENGIDKPNRTGIDARSVFVMPMRFKMADGFPAITTKKLAWKSVVSELLWFIEGSSDERRLAEILHGDRNSGKTTIWTANAEAPFWKPKVFFSGDLGRVYGVQWRSWRAPDGREIDQLKNVVERIKKDPFDRRLVVSAWNPGELDQMALPPCHMLYQFFAAGGKLSLMMVQRSCDMFLGVPFNIASYALLLNMVAHVTDFEPHELVISFNDAHIYRNHFEQVSQQLGRQPFPLPKLWLNPEIKDIDKFTMDDIKLMDYQCHPAIKAEMAV
jgi:thymidylate synthase